MKRGTSCSPRKDPRAPRGRRLRNSRCTKPAGRKCLIWLGKALARLCLISKKILNFWAVFSKILPIKDQTIKMMTSLRGTLSIENKSRGTKRGRMAPRSSPWRTSRLSLKFRRTQKKVRMMLIYYSCLRMRQESKKKWRSWGLTQRAGILKTTFQAFTSLRRGGGFGRCARIRIPKGTRRFRSTREAFRNTPMSQNQWEKRKRTSKKTKIYLSHTKSKWNLKTSRSNAPNLTKWGRHPGYQ